jgi:hypothetical protein
MINEKAKPSVARGDARALSHAGQAGSRALSNVGYVVELADQLSTCAGHLHERVMREIRAYAGKTVSQATQDVARALLDDEMLLRQRANSLSADAATYVVQSLGESQQHLLALTKAAAEKIGETDKLGDAASLVAALLGVAAAATTGRAAPILLSLQSLMHEFERNASLTNFKAQADGQNADRAETAGTSNGQFATDDPTREALARGELRLVKWTKDGTLIDGKPLADAWDITRQGLDKARERGEIFSVRVKGRHYYSTEAVHFKRNDLAEINRALGDIDPASKLIFLRRKHGALGGRTPADAVEKGKLMDVVRLAKDWADN